MNRPPDHPDAPTGGIGVLLVNLGTPDSPTPKAVRRYLAEFLSDRRVVEIPAVLWQPILRGIILNVRPRKSAHAYAQVWTDQGSPLAAITAEQAEALQAMMGDNVRVTWAMRYGQPSIGAQLELMKADGIDRILLAPLYPQYCSATTATAVDAAALALQQMRWQPAIRTLPPYHDDPAYIAALASDIGTHLDALAFDPELLVLSFHGMPRRTLDLGDPYHCHCRKTARLLEAALAGRIGRVETSFQSRFGRAQWLEPSTENLLADAARQGTTRIAIAAPGFAADCLETLEELAIRGKEQFLSAGGREFAYLPCLNAGSAGMDMLQTIVGRELSGWI